MILLGLNQTILLALSMLVITALVGTRDLGQEVYAALATADVGRGLVAGLCVAFLAIVADRLVGGRPAGCGQDWGSAEHGRRTRAARLAFWGGPVAPEPLGGGITNPNFLVDDAARRASCASATTSPSTRSCAATSSPPAVRPMPPGCRRPSCTPSRAPS